MHHSYDHNCKEKMIVTQGEATAFKDLSQQAAFYLTLETADSTPKLAQARNQVFHLGATVGNLCQAICTHAPLDPYRPLLPPGEVETESFPATLGEHPFWSNDNDESLKAREEIYHAIGKVFWSLLLLTTICNIDLRASIQKKMELNAKKYPAHLCKGKSGKYTEYSDETGITETNQSMLDIEIPEDIELNDSTERQEVGMSPRSVVAAPDVDVDSSTVPGIAKLIREFAMERNWSKYHTPRNIVLAMMGEVGELAELFQWRGDKNCETDGNNESEGGLDWEEKDFDHLEQEVADVAIYCLRLADVVGIQDLGLLACSILSDSKR
jgi:NTP pyrophosphatase (non-canonical NTP hydrolase)